MAECGIVDSFLLGLCVIVTKDLPSFCFVYFCLGFLVALFATGRPSIISCAIAVATRNVGSFFVFCFYLRQIMTEDTAMCEP